MFSYQFQFLIRLTYLKGDKVRYINIVLVGNNLDSYNATVRLRPCQVFWCRCRGSVSIIGFFPIGLTKHFFFFFGKNQKKNLN